MPPKKPPQPMLPKRVTLNGAWRLDVQRGDQIRGYLTAMDCSEMAIEAMEKAEKEVDTIHIITISPSSYTIVKKSRVNDMKESFAQNTRCSTHIAISKDGSSTKEKTTYVTSTDDLTSVIVKSVMPTTNGMAEVVDARRLESGWLYQELAITNLSTGKSSLTRRWFCPCEMPVVEPPPVQLDPMIMPL
ncbi:hypothetical protein TrCOL_g1217 [Triparma columacea]|uniref:Uncharacterized protein n=2 Tax=Triparma columacea TaxID=722753 RepID=A0A9W7GNI0_9STRA|nr:hypothetical protein TrCOL_g1217 [Triparma columacea]